MSSPLFLDDGASQELRGPYMLLLIITPHPGFCLNSAMLTQGTELASTCLVLWLTTLYMVSPKRPPTPGSSCFSRAFCYFSFFCSDASVGLASTVGSGSNGSDGGFVSWAPPTTPCKETKLEFLVIPFHKKSFKRELCIVWDYQDCSA